MRALWLVLLLSSACVGMRGMDRRPAMEVVKASADELAKSLIDDDSPVGLVVGTWRDDRAAFASYGHASLTSSRAPGPDTVFEIGSITKTMTAIALAKLVIDGKVHLDDPLAWYLPELSGTDTGRRSLLELATHTSGLPRLPTDLFAPPYDPLQPYRLYDWGRALKSLRALPLPPPPKTFDAQQYSNLGFGLLALALARSQLISVEALLRREVLAPLGLKDTSVTLTASQRARLAQGYDEALDPVPPWKQTQVFQGAGAIRSTPRDLLLYMKANLFPEATKIPKALRLAETLQRSGEKISIGLGWMMQGRGAGEVIWHDGETGGYYAFLAMRPALKEGVVLLANTASTVECVGQIAIGLTCERPRAVALSSETRAAFVGSYDFGSGMKLEVISRRSFLVGKLRETGQPVQKLRLHPRSETRFALGPGDVATLEFQKDEGAPAKAVVLTQDGRRMAGRRE